MNEQISDIKNVSVKEDAVLDQPIGYLCPACGGLLTFKSWGLGCSNHKNGCKYSIPKVIAGKKLSENQITILFTKRKTALIRSFVSKSGKKYGAKLKLEDIKDETGKTISCKIIFDFSHSYPGGIARQEYSNMSNLSVTQEVFSNSPSPSLPSESLAETEALSLLCPACGTPLLTTKWAWRCSAKCGFSVNRIIAKRQMEESEIQDLLQSGKTNELQGFISKEGKPFSAALRLKEGNKMTEFDFRKNNTSISAQNQESINTNATNASDISE